MNNNSLIQKKHERIFLDDFLNYYSKIDPNINSYKILLENESPDFIISIENLKVAIEITEYYQGVKSKNGPIEKICLAKKQKIIKLTKEVFERICDIRINVCIRWTEYDFSLLNNEEIKIISEVFSERLLAATKTHFIYSYNNLESFVGKSGLAKYISYIDISNKIWIDKLGNSFSFSSAGCIENSVLNINNLISEKNLKYNLYVSNLQKKSIKCDLLWLLIDANGEYLASTAHFESIELACSKDVKNANNIVQSSFDNIFIFDSCFKRFAKIK